MFRTTELISQPLSHSDNDSKTMPSFDSLPGKTTVLPSTNISLSSQLSEEPKAKAVSSRKPATPNVPHLAKVSKDNRGQWGYSPWPISLGSRNTVSGISSTQKIGRVRVVKFQERIYQPVHRQTVCIGSTIPYGVHKVMNWVDRHVYKHMHTSRGFFMDLRRNMFMNGNSEMCHSKKYSTWMVYQECALQRNQRLESYIPKYPLQQKVKEIVQQDSL